MSARLEMLQVARLATNVLGEASEKVGSFLAEQITETGAGRDRAGDPDLYYTVFVLDGLTALQSPVPERCATYLESRGTGDGLDLVHLACLARCWAAAPKDPAPPVAEGILQRIESHRRSDGGYGDGGAYHGFLALGAYQDLHHPPPDADALGRAVRALRTADGAFSNLPGLPVGSTTATAAAVTTLRQIGQPVDAPRALASWLLAQGHVDGGFLAAPRAPIPDLLSTATALHALASLDSSIPGGAPLPPHFAERCLDFVDTLWTGQGFCGNWTDDAVDAEYTFYALLALGHLSLATA